ncbi:Protein RESTRICTED TEV MOVEMENT 2, partial [Mucuna pruriens]
MSTQTYEDLEAKYETEETPESTVLRVHIPDGFERQHVGAKIEYDFARVRVHGERSLGINRRVRFNAVYQVPEYCDINRIKGKYEGKFVIITIPNIPGKVPTKQEPPQPTQQEAEPNKEDEKEATPPTYDDQEKKTIDNATSESKEEAHHETSTSPKDTQEFMHQKGQEGIPQKHVGQETSTPPKDTQESMPQKGGQEQEAFPPKDTNTITKVESEKQVGDETSTSTPTKDIEESLTQKGQEQEGMPPKATSSTNAKLQGEEKFEGKVDENEEKTQNGIGEKETEDHSKKTMESGKPHEKDEADDSPKKEGKEESKGLDTFEGEKGISGYKIGNDDVEKKKKGMPESSTTRTRIREVAASASQAVTSLAKRFNEEDKQRIVYMSAAVLVVALGVYATYKLRTSRRP